MTLREIGSETLVNPVPYGSNEGIALTVGLTGGGYVVIWQANDGDIQSDVRARIFDASGNATGPAFTILNDYVGFEFPRNVDAIALPNGGFAIASTHVLSTNSIGQAVTSEITLQYFGATGAATSSIISVSAANGYVSEPELTLAGNRVVVAWDGGDVAESPLQGRSFDLNGAAVTGIFTIDSGVNGASTGSGTNSPAIAGFTSGGFVTAWRDTSADAGDIRVRLFDAAGSATGQSLVVSANSAGTQSLPHLSVLANNTAIVTWADLSSGVLIIRGQLLSSSGAKIGGEFTIADTGQTADTNLNDYGLTALADGGFVVTWRERADDRVYVREFDAAGTALRAETVVSDSQGFFPHVDALSTGGYVVSWSLSGAVRTQKIVNVPNSVADGDFNGNGSSDVLLQSSTGEITIWRGQSNGALVPTSGLAANALDANWRPAGYGDFNGDGREDVLFRHSTGQIGEWLGQVNQFTNNSGVAANAVDLSWAVVGVADYNGDGRDDILWRHNSGEIGQWGSNANGSFYNNGGAAANFVDNSWTVLASGDFNGDGRADVLWRHSSGVYAEWQGSASGKLVNNGAVLAGATGTVVGSGDFNGDGLDDILMRNATSGSLTTWLGQSNGQFTAITPTQQLTDLNWKIADIGDYNGDGRDDLIWRHTSGVTGEWLGTATGDFAYNGAGPTIAAGTNIISPDIWLV